MKRISFQSVRRALIALAIIAIVLIYIGKVRSENLVSSSQTWIVHGSFTKGPFATNSDRPTKFDIGISNREKQQVDFWASAAGDAAHTSELQSPVFLAPAILECFLSGYPGRPGQTLYLERESDHAQFPLALAGNSLPGEIWRPFRWRIPSAFRSQKVRLVAINQSSDYLGVSTPRRFSYLSLLHYQLPSSLTLIFRTLLTFVLFLIPGFAFTSWLVSRWPHLSRYTLILITACAAAIGYLAFYIYFFSTPAGRFFSLFVDIGSLLLMRRAALRLIFKDVAEPLALTASVALCYLCFAFLFITPTSTGASYINDRFFNVRLPGDNLIPQIFAEKIYNRQPIRPFCCGDWLSSDRPPLETGIFLLQRPAPWVKNVDLDYELLATTLQCLWICGVWSLLVSLGTPLLHIRRALLFLVFSGVILFNSVYTWPKFLAATFILFVLSIVIQALRDGSSLSRAGAIIAGLCLGLAFVSHPGGVYSLIAFPLLWLRFRHSLPLRKLTLALPIILAFVLPWIAYQKLVDPPGNRLIKWHLAGHPQPDSLTAWQELRAAYTSHTPAQILALRAGNFVYLASDDFHVPASTIDAREAQREHILQAIGVLNIGFIGLFFCLKKKILPAIPCAGWILLAVSVNLLVWCCLEFGPHYTSLIHSSYADFLLLSLGLLGFLLALPRAFVIAAFILQIANFFVVWVWSPATSFAHWGGPVNVALPQLPLLAIGILASLLLIRHLASIPAIPRR